MPFTLLLKDAKAAALKAFDEGRLLAQAVNKRDRVCRYRGRNGMVCAVGAGLPDDIAKKFDSFFGGNSAVVSVLIDLGELSTDHPERLALLQMLHDNAYFFDTAPEDLRARMEAV